MYRTDFSRIIKAKRSELKIGQVDMAALLDISYRHYQDIETGKINLRLDTIVKISEKLNIHFCIQNGRIHEGLKSGEMTDLQLINQVSTQMEIGVAIFNKDTSYFFINDFLAQINSVPPKNHSGKKISDIVPEIAVKLELSIHKCINDKEVIFKEISGLIPRDLFETHYQVAMIPYDEDKVLMLVKDRTIYKAAHESFKELSTKLKLQISIPSMEIPLRKMDRDAAIGNWDFLKTLIMQLYR